MIELSGYELEVVLPRLSETTWRRATDLCVTPESLKRLAEAGKAERYHDGRRWQYRRARAGEQERNGKVSNPAPNQ